MNILLFITVLVVSFLVVRIGAIAFQLTGLEWSLAKFQALSCFTGTGFTTKEAELITNNPRRRRIASVIMVLGNAGFITMIATFANSLRPRAIVEKLDIPLLPFSIPNSALPWINLTITAVAIYIIYKFFTNTKVARRLTSVLRKHITRKKIIKSVSFEELTVVTGGYGVSKIEIREDNPVSNKTLLESSLRSHGIIVLAIIKAGKTMPNPSADTKIVSGDELVCFGNLDNIKNTICVVNN